MILKIVKLCLTARARDSYHIKMLLAPSSHIENVAASAYIFHKHVLITCLYLPF